MAKKQLDKEIRVAVVISVLMGILFIDIGQESQSFNIIAGGVVGGFLGIGILAFFKSIMGEL